MRTVAFPRAWRTAALAAIATSALSAGLAAAQLGDPRGPGEGVAQPPAMCSQTISCTYAERKFPGGQSGYRFQSLNLCGANCTTQYWVSDVETGKPLLSVDPVRGGGYVAVGRATSQEDTHPAIRVIVPDYAPTDAACCPSGYRDTTYTWSATTSALVAGAPTVVPSAQFPGWQALREQWQSQEFFPAFPGA